MQPSDDGAPTYTPDHELSGSDSEDTLFGTDSLSSYSMSTLNSDEVAAYFHMVHGLPYSSDENVPLFLPALDTAVRLREINHTLARLSQDGTNVPPEVDTVLRAGEPRGPANVSRVLDLFTNEGTWVKEMAETYPDASFLSVDVKPFTAHQRHSRIVYEVYDLYAGIAEPDSSFDVVNTLNCVIETRDFNFLLREMHRVLKPGGVLVITEIPFHCYKAKNPLEEIQAPESHYAAGLSSLCRAFQAQGIDTNVWGDISARLGHHHPLWAERLVDVHAGVIEQPSTSPSVRGFHSIIQRTRLIPYSPWPRDRGQRMLGSATFVMITDAWPLFDPILLMAGLQQDEINTIGENVTKELTEGRIRGYLKSHRWSAKKL